jgi:hypothetical protein
VRRHGVGALDEVRPLHVAAWTERQTRECAATPVSWIRNGGLLIDVQNPFFRCDFVAEIGQN